MRKTIKKPIRRAQDGIRAKADNTSVSKRPVSAIVKKSNPKYTDVGSGFPASQMKQRIAMENKRSKWNNQHLPITDLMTKKDSSEYTKGYNEARSNYLQNKPVKKNISYNNDPNWYGDDDTTSFRSRGYREGQRELGFKKRKGGKITKAKTGKMIPKKSSVSKRLGSAKKSIGNRLMKRK